MDELKLTKEDFLQPVGGQGSGYIYKCPLFEMGMHDVPKERVAYFVTSLHITRDELQRAGTEIYCQGYTYFDLFVEKYPDIFPEAPQA